MSQSRRAPIQSRHPAAARPPHCDRRSPAPNFRRRRWRDPRRPRLRAAPRSSPSDSNSHPPPSHIAGKTSPAAAIPPHTKNISCRHPTQFPHPSPRVFTPSLCLPAAAIFAVSQAAKSSGACSGQLQLGHLTLPFAFAVTPSFCLPCHRKGAQRRTSPRSPLSPQRLAARFTPKARNKTSTNNSATRTFGVRWLLALGNEGCHRLAQLNSPTKLPRVAKSVHTACSGQLRLGQLPLPFVLPVGLAERVSLCGAGLQPRQKQLPCVTFPLARTLRKPSQDASNPRSHPRR